MQKSLIHNYLHYHYKLFLLSEKFVIEDTCEEETVNVNLELFNLAFKNIIDNALKYSASNDVIRVTTKVEDESVVFSVYNPLTVAIKPDVHQLGIPLYRANPSDGRGLGLGLGIVKHVAEMHNCELNYYVTDMEFGISLRFAAI